MKSSRLFGSLSDNLLQKLTPLLKIKHFPESTEIVEEGKINSQVFFLIKGKIAVYSKGELILKLRRTGDMCGEMSVISKKPCVASEVADTAVDCFGLHINDMYDNSVFSSDELLNLLFRLFSVMLIDKLTLATYKAREYETVNQKFKESNDNLYKATEEAALAHGVKRNFLDNINHEIRTPMHGVIGMTSLLLTTDLSDKQKEFTEIIEKSANALLAVINDILQHSDIESGKVEIKNKIFHLDSLLRKIVQEMSEKAREKRLDMFTQIGTDVPRLLRGDSLRLHQVLINLAGNAVKFTKKGKISIQVDKENESENNIGLRFSVTDTGIGIPDSHMDRLFQPFSQGDPSSTRKYGGAGLGLVICRQLIEIMGGKIGVTSEEGRGSTFWFTLELNTQEERRLDEITILPEHRKPARATDQEEPIFKDVKSNAQILLVEDDKVNQVVATFTLQRLGYRVDAVDSGRKALRILSTIPYDIVLMDIQMPEMDGFETTRLIRDPKSRALDPNVPIIAMTAHILECDKQACIDNGMNDFLVKPFANDDLDIVIRKWLPEKEDTNREFQRKMEKTKERSINADTLDQLRRNVGDIGPLIHLFLEELPQKVDNLSQAIANDNPSDMEKAAHVLKSNCYTFGAMAMAELCRTLELLGKSGTTDTAAGLLIRLIEEGEWVILELNEKL
ncbi:MAG: response regulator [Proteobacteria bacterium]|nr:response regulator [Pseudomonadota bacterium]